jgi:hypothetical protein
MREGESERERSLAMTGFGTCGPWQVLQGLIEIKDTYRP